MSIVMKKVLLLMGFLMSVSLVASCGSSSSDSSSSGTDSGGTVSTISQLPYATGAMSTSASAQVSKIKGVTKALTDTMNFSTATEDTFKGVNNSMGACEMFNMARGALSSAAMGDMILCFIKNTAGTNESIYDGSYYIFSPGGSDSSAKEEGEGGPPAKMKMRITKDANGNVNLFEMFSCNAQNVQTEYLKQTFTGTDLTMVAKGSHGNGSWSGWHWVDVAGKLDSNNLYTSKTIHIRDTGGSLDGSSTHNQEGTFTQTPGHGEFSGYRFGSGSDSYGTFSYSDRIYALMDIIDDSNTDIRVMSLGQGASNVVMTGAFGGDNSNMNFVDAWDVDAKGTNNTYKTTVKTHELPTVGTVSIAFDASLGETWDCSGDVTPLPNGQGQVDEAALQQQCASFSLPMEWINCQQAVPESDGTQCNSHSLCQLAPTDQIRSMCEECFEGDDPYSCLQTNCNSMPDPSLCADNIQVCNKEAQ